MRKHGGGRTEHSYRGILHALCDNAWWAEGRLCKTQTSHYHWDHCVLYIPVYPASLWVAGTSTCFPYALARLYSEQIITDGPVHHGGNVVVLFGIGRPRRFATAAQGVCHCLVMAVAVCISGCLWFGISCVWLPRCEGFFPLSSHYHGLSVCTQVAIVEPLCLVKEGSSVNIRS